MEGVGDEVLVLSTVLAIGGGLLLLIGRNQRTNTQLQPAPPPREAGVRENSTRDPAHMPSTASVTVDCRVVDGDSRKIAVPIPCTFGEIKQMAFGTEIALGQRVRVVYQGRERRNSEQLCAVEGNRVVLHAVVSGLPDGTLPSIHSMPSAAARLSRTSCNPLPLLAGAALLFVWFCVLSVPALSTPASLLMLVGLSALFIVFVAPRGATSP